jgi:flagellar assembly protein FliH
MTTATKFSFDTTFDLSDQVSGHMPEQEVTPPEPTFSAAELEAARTEGFNDGHQAGLSESTSTLESAATQAMSDIALQLASLGPACQTGIDQCRHETIGIAHAVTRRMVEISAQETALQVIESVLSDMLARVIDEPRVVIRVNNDLLDTLQQRISSVTDKCGFPGSVILLSDPDVQLPDCRIEWADGGAEYSSEAILTEIDATLERYRAGIGTTAVDIADTAAAETPQTPQTPDTHQTPPIDIEEQSNG